ncbi:hypothetical protein [Dokdonella fugitiva]|uniref:Uncharacterized protein n=1 Tax=Dokdonella fugitiva TaxID=328517 RepID=A0A4R2IB58_9GAMM|nr:hypothetical protein [Dokdonella fugitiva]MBA8885699.1 hypothetical protein [Dokdonella fugitiva]TCO41734.1 hypothetical protein EV148_10284 [Dokdonella fugitiva]
MAKRRKSMAIPTPVDEDWQRVQAKIDAIVHERDQPPDKPARRRIPQQPPAPPARPRE